MDNKTKKTVLIVDDDVQVLKSLKIWLRSEGFNIEIAPDREKALKIVEEKEIDAALVDLRMIKDDGINISKRLKTFDKHLKIIILTGYPSFDTAVEAMKIGAFDYLSKGSSNEKILSTINSAIAERKKENGIVDQTLEEKEKINVILFCDHSLIKERLESISEKSPVFQLVETFAQVDSIKPDDSNREPDIALICAGCNLKDLKDAADIFSEISRFFPGIKPVIINETFSNTEKAKLLQLGVKGFASKVLSSKKLEKGLLHVKKGGFLVDQQVVNLSMQNETDQSSSQLFKGKDMMGLTTREIEILSIMAQGLKNREIADKLAISEKTVKTHLNRIFKKLGVNSRSQAILTLMEKKIL
jgi:DNA-binding NarL/FixJ family response regulator